MKLRKLFLGLAVAILAGCGGGVFVDFSRSALGTLDTGDSFANNRYYDVWTFVPNQTGTASFGMNSPDFAPHLEIEDENGDVIADNDHEGSDADVEISAFMRRDHTYYVITTSAFSGDLGDYELLWESSTDLIDFSARPAKVKPTGKAGIKGAQSTTKPSDPAPDQAKAPAAR